MCSATLPPCARTHTRAIQRDARSTFVCCGVVSLIVPPPCKNRSTTDAPRTSSRYPSFKTPGGIVRLLDYVGTVSFAMSGAATAGMRGLNLLGCMFVGVLAATGGGTLRDLLLGQTPVFWLVEVRL